MCVPSSYGLCGNTCTRVNPCVFVSVYVCSYEYTGAGMTWFLVQTFGGAIPPCPHSTRLSSVSAVAYGCAPSYRTLVEMTLGKSQFTFQEAREKGEILDLPAASFLVVRADPALMSLSMRSKHWPPGYWSHSSGLTGDLHAGDSI